MLATPAPAPALPAVKVDSAWVASARATRVAALSLRGVPPAAHVVLRCGGSGCPFLAQWAYGQAGVALPRTADDQCRSGAPVARADLLSGDVVCFDDATGYIGHVGLYAGNDRFLHSPHTGAVIGYDALTDPYYSARFAGGRR